MMMLILRRVFTAALLPGSFMLIVAAAPVKGAEIDFSCMSYTVRGKVQLVDQYKEYDVILRNRCRGPVYWTMCIERLDPYTHEIVEVHTPSGYIEPEKTARVNLHLKKGPEEMEFRKRFQELYVSAGYSIDDRAEAACIARQCEMHREKLRQRIDSNLQAWQKAQSALDASLIDDCPESGWDKTEEVETCRAAIREAAEERLQAFADTDASLRKELLSAGSGRCRLEAGDLVAP